MPHQLLTLPKFFARFSPEATVPSAMINRPTATDVKIGKVGHERVGGFKGLEATAPVTDVGHGREGRGGRFGFDHGRVIQ